MSNKSLLDMGTIKATLNNSNSILSNFKMGQYEVTDIDFPRDTRWQYLYKILPFYVEVSSLSKDELYVVTGYSEEDHTIVVTRRYDNDKDQLSVYARSNSLSGRRVNYRDISRMCTICDLNKGYDFIEVPGELVENGGGLFIYLEDKDELHRVSLYSNGTIYFSDERLQPRWQPEIRYKLFKYVGINNIVPSSKVKPSEMLGRFCFHEDIGLFYKCISIDEKVIIL